MTTQLLLAAGFLAATNTLHAQNPQNVSPIGLDYNNSIYVNDFDGRFPGTTPYEGTVATLPMGVESNFQLYLGKGDGLSQSSNPSNPGQTGIPGQGGYYAYHEVGNSNEVSLGLQNDGADPMYYEFNFVNNSPRTISAVYIGYNFEQYFYRNTSGIAVTSTLGDVSALSQAGDAPAAGLVDGTVKSTTKATTLTGLSIPQGGTFKIRFAGSAQTTQGNNGLGVDNLTVSVTYNQPLPVELTAFAATPVQSGARLTWSTATEQENAFFGVEMSRDGLAFEEMGRVLSQGNSNEAQAYEFDLAGLRAGTVYFRLAQNDYDGQVTYSPVTSVVIDGPKKGFSIVASHVAAQIQLESDDAGTGTIVTAAGQQIRRVRLVEGSQTVDVSDLAAGMYFLSNGETTVRFVK